MGNPRTRADRSLGPWLDGPTVMEREPADLPVDTEAAEVRRGWGWPLASRKAHYFVDGMSLCRKWVYTGEPTAKQSTSAQRGPDDCAECHRKYVAAYGRAQEVKRGG